MIISLEHVSMDYAVRVSLFNYKKIRALEQVSFEISRGDSLGVIGRNGAGKSTLLRLLAGILEPSEGTIQRQKDLNVSILTLQLGFLEDLTGVENAILGATKLAKGSRLRKGLIDDIGKLSQLGKRMQDPVKYFSSGMRARLAFSIAYHMDPDLLIIDEALGVGDHEFRGISTKLMKEKIKSDQTVVFVSHNPYITKELCNKVLWLEGGTVRDFGETKSIMQQYLASFLK